ncbi:MAG TPA: hypothetical protein VHE35_00160 [Kofleriaceae bacterium]|nr:hypothetical protein [Kofleriaceae bacterium]
MRAALSLTLIAIAGCSAAKLGVGYHGGPHVTSGSSASAGADDQPHHATDDQSDDAIVARTTGHCDAAHDHCLDADTWFAVDPEQARHPPAEAFPGHWTDASPGEYRSIWAWRCDCTVGAYGMRTVPASADNVKVGARAIIYWENQRVELPEDQLYARKHDWLESVVASVDARGKTFRMTGVADPVPYGVARIVVEERTDVPATP